jgi:DNA-binding NtrC family response regulator
MLTVESLEGLGFKVETAGSAAEARSKLRLLNGNVDAIILDIGLPDAKGDVLLNELQSIYPTLPVLIASGHDEVLLRKRFAGQKLIGFLSKPYTLDELGAALRSVGAHSPTAPA